MAFSFYDAYMKTIVLKQNAYHLQFYLWAKIIERICLGFSKLLNVIIKKVGCFFFSKLMQSHVVMSEPRTINVSKFINRV